MQDSQQNDDDIDVVQFALEIIEHQKQLKLQNIPFCVLINIVHHLDIDSVLKLTCVSRILSLLSKCDNLLFFVNPEYILRRNKHIDFNKHCWSNVQILELSYCITEWRLTVDNIDEFINDRKQNASKYIHQMMNKNWCKSVQHLCLELDGDELAFQHNNFVSKLPKFMNLKTFNYSVIWEDEPDMLDWQDHTKNPVQTLDYILYNKIHPVHLTELCIDDLRVSYYSLKYILYCRNLEKLEIHNVYQSDHYWDVEHKAIEKWLINITNDAKSRLDHIRHIVVNDEDRAYDVCHALFDLFIFLKLLIRNVKPDTLHFEICGDDFYDQDTSTAVLFNNDPIESYHVNVDILSALKSFCICGNARYIGWSLMYIMVPLMKENRYRQTQHGSSRFILDRFECRIRNFSTFYEDKFVHLNEFLYMLMDSVNNTIFEISFDMIYNELKTVKAVNDYIKQFRKQIFGCSGEFCDLYFNGYICKCCAPKMSEMKLRGIRSDSFWIKISAKDMIRSYRQKENKKVQIKDFIPVLFDFLPCWMSVISSLKTKLFNSFGFEYTFSAYYGDDGTLTEITQYLKHNYKQQLVKIDKHHKHCFTYHLKIV
eukprot:70638_1